MYVGSHTTCRACTVQVLREVLHQAGGVQVLDGWSITQAQVDGKGGGDVLRQENASFGATVKPVKKAQKMLQDGMDKAGAAVPLVILPAHQTEALLYEGGSMDDQMRGRPQPHLKASAVAFMTTGCNLDDLLRLA